MKSKLNPSASIENLVNTNKRRRFEFTTSSEVRRSLTTMTSSDESEKGSSVVDSRKGSISPESCNDEDGVEGRNKVFSCSLCSYRTDRKNNLKRHTLTMHELSQALLECCNLRFLNKAELRMHTQKYHADGYYCEVCDRSFCRKALLKRHFSVHSGYKEFSCHFCGYETSHKSNLERHMRVHRKSSTTPPALLPQQQPLITAGRNNSGSFLHKLPHAVPFRTSLLTASQSHPVLPTEQAQPPVLPNMSEPRHPPLGSSWPVLNPPTSTPTVTFPNPFLENPFQKHQQSVIYKMPPKADPLSPQTHSKMKKNTSKKDFSVSALLGEDIDVEEIDGGKNKTMEIMSHQAKPSLRNDSFPVVFTSTAPSSVPRVPTRIQRPTPVHAHARHFTHPFMTSFHTGAHQSAIYTQAIISLQANSQRHSQNLTRDSREMKHLSPSLINPSCSSPSVSFSSSPSSASYFSPFSSLRSCSSPRAFTSFHGPSPEKGPSYREVPSLHLASLVSSQNPVSPPEYGGFCPPTATIQQLQLRSFQQRLPGMTEKLTAAHSLLARPPSPVGLLETPMNRPSKKQVGSISLTHTSLSYPLSQPIHTHKISNPDTGALEASPGYVAPGLEQRSGCSFLEATREAKTEERKTTEGKVSNATDFQSHIKVREEEKDGGEMPKDLPSPETMETDQEYIPKKLRAARKFQSV